MSESDALSLTPSTPRKLERNELRIADRREKHAVRAVGKLVDQVSPDLQSQAGLARPPRGR